MEAKNRAKATNMGVEYSVIARERSPVMSSPRPAVRRVPMDPNRLTASEPAMTPAETTTSSMEYVNPPELGFKRNANASSAGKLIAIRDAARVPTTKCGREESRAQARRSEP